MSRNTSKGGAKSGVQNVKEVSGYKGPRTKSTSRNRTGFTTGNGDSTNGSNPSTKCDSKPKGSYMLPDGTCIPGVRPGYTRGPPQRRTCDESTTISNHSNGNETFVSGPMQPRDGKTPSQRKNRSKSSTRSSSKSSIATSGYSSASSTGSCISGHIPAQVSGTKTSTYAEVIPQVSGTKTSTHAEVIPGLHQNYTNTSSPKLAKGKPTSDVAHQSGTGKCYVNNAYNRRLGRVGKPLRTCIVRSHSVTESTKKSQTHKKLLEENKLEDLVQALNGLQATSQPGVTDEYTHYQYAVDRLYREEVEESWKANCVEPSSVNITSLIHHYPENQIPFADLELEKVIGRGSFGEVYAGCLLGKPIAFKKLSYQQMSMKWKTNFTKEVTILATTHHPSVIKMLGYVNEDDNIGIVMEYLRCSLYRAVFIDCTLQDVDKKNTIVGQVSSALNYLHTHSTGRIAHCDIKSENVLLDWSNNAILCDFGLSALKNAASTESSVPGIVPPGQGTPRYSAPEVLRGELLTMTQLLQTDIYSLAVVVFEVMTEEEPFEGLSVKQLETNVGHGTMQPVSSKLSQAIDDLLTRCWDRVAINRPTAAEFEEAWRTIVAP